MSVEKLQRVLLRIRRNNPHGGSIPNKELQIAIMKECGTDPTTRIRNRHALKTLGWIRPAGKKHFYLTDKDLEGNW